MLEGSWIIKSLFRLKSDDMKRGLFMEKPFIHTRGEDPRDDGEIGLFQSPEAKGKSWYVPKARVVFVNGMANSGADHAKSARALSLLQACPVIGVYNKKGGFLPDIWQCLVDKLTLVGVQSQPSNFEGWSKQVEAGYQNAKKAVPSLQKIDFVEGLIGANKAARSLYRYYVTLSGNERRKTKIFCHSQGNLITSNALTAVALAVGPQAIKGLQVFSFGSPALYWPSGIVRVNRAFTFDPVSWLDYRFSFDNVKIGYVAAHGFDIYMKYDAEFAVNRFRWGSHGMTASMDEQGLAKYCVSLGTNARRLKPIFKRLIDAHWSDCDDVAFEYTKLMRRPENLAKLKKLAVIDDSFIHQLIYCMAGGTFNYTSSAEKDEIKFLQSIRKK